MPSNRQKALPMVRYARAGGRSGVEESEHVRNGVPQEPEISVSFPVSSGGDRS